MVQTYWSATLFRIPARKSIDLNSFPNATVPPVLVSPLVRSLARSLRATTGIPSRPLLIARVSPAYTVRARFFGNDTGHSTNSWRFERLRSPNRRTTISRKSRHFVCNRGSVVNTVRNIESPILPVGFNQASAKDGIPFTRPKVDVSTSNC